MTLFTRARSGLVTQLLLPVIAILLPLAMVMLYRSQQQLKWVQKAQHQFKAQEALRCAQEVLREKLRAGVLQVSERRSGGEGGYEVTAKLDSAGALGQPIVRYQASGTHLGEQATVEGFAEIARVQGRIHVLFRDSSSRSGPRVERYVAQARAEAGMSSTQYLNVMRDQCHRLGSPDVEDAWSDIGEALERSKFQMPPQPGPSRAELTQLYLGYSGRMEGQREEGRLREALRSEEFLVSFYRTYLLTEDGAGAIARRPDAPGGSSGGTDAGPDTSPGLSGGTESDPASSGGSSGGTAGGAGTEPSRPIVPGVSSGGSGGGSSNPDSAGGSSWEVATNPSRPDAPGGSGGPPPTQGGPGGTEPDTSGGASTDPSRPGGPGASPRAPPANLVTAGWENALVNAPVGPASPPPAAGGPGSIPEVRVPPEEDDPESDRVQVANDPPAGPPGDRLDPIGPMGTLSGAINPNADKLKDGSLLDRLRNNVPSPSPSP